MGRKARWVIYLASWEELQTLRNLKNVEELDGGAWGTVCFRQRGQHVRTRRLGSKWHIWGKRSRTANRQSESVIEETGVGDSSEFVFYPKGNENPLKCPEEGEQGDRSSLLDSDWDCDKDGDGLRQPAAWDTLGGSHSNTGKWWWLLT